jgi:tRNA pseudouridine55 synthase
VATANSFFPPLVFNLYKHAGGGSQDIVRALKRALPKGTYGKIGHFGTLDPFACGVLMVGVGGAARLNDLIHADCPKSYLARGVLGISTDTGDPEGKVTQRDESSYLKDVIGSFDRVFVQQCLAGFKGEYWQAPPAYSAAKHEGRPLHEWARAGVEIKKEKVRREIYRCDVVAWEFPHLTIRVEVSSGTYVRTLFEEACQALGTIGHLQFLEREAVGPVTKQSALLPETLPPAGAAVEAWLPLGLRPQDVLPYARRELQEGERKTFLNGGALLRSERETAARSWLEDSSGELLGLLQQDGDRWKVEINFAASAQAARGLL